MVATVETGFDEPVESEQHANARLIAAAPELLVVVKDFYEVLAEKHLFCECGEQDCRTTRLRAVLAKVQS